MLDYNTLNNFRLLFEKDQGPVTRKLYEVDIDAATDSATGLINTCKTIEQSSYEAGRYIYSVTFENNIYGEVSIRVHVMWQLFEELLATATDKDSFDWSSCDFESVHAYLALNRERYTVYTVVLGRDELIALCDRVKCPHTEFDSAEDLLCKLYQRGVWCK